MKFKEYILMSLRDLWRRKGRTILTSLGITIGTLLIVTMVGLGNGVQNFMYDTVNSQDNARNISIMPLKYMTNDEMDSADQTTFMQDNFKILDDNLIKSLDETNNIESLVASVSSSLDNFKLNDKEYSGQIQYTGYNKNANVYPDFKIEKIRHEKDDDSIKPIKAGRDIKETTGEILIGEGIIKQLNIEPADIINKKIQLIINNSTKNGLDVKPITKEFTIVGVVDENFDDGQKFVMSANDAAQLKGFSTFENEYLKSKGYDSIEIVTNKISDVQPVSDEIKDSGYYYKSSIDTAKQVESSMEGIKTAFAVLGVIVLVVSAIGIVNTMTMAVIERTKSIGVMKAVGANSGAIRIIFLTQSSLIGFIGGVFGILIGLGINQIVQSIANSKITSSGMTTSISVGLPWYYTVGILIFAMAIALVSGIYPANQASKLEPIEALRR